MKKVISLVLILVLVLSMVACGSKELVGKWEVADDMGLGISMVLEFTEDQIDMFGMKVDYKVKGNTIIVEAEGEEGEMEYKIDGDTLTLTVDGESMELKRVDE